MSLQYKILIAMLLVLFLAGYSQRESGITSKTKLTWSSSEQSIIQSLSLDNLPTETTDPSNKVHNNSLAAAFGEQLFNDVRLSGSNTISCATCHQSSLHFTDGKTVAEGIALASRNTPSLIGIAHNNWFFWDGRKDSLWSQALGPIEHTGEMGGSRLKVAHLISQSEEYTKFYNQIFGELPDLTDKQRFPEHAGPVGPARQDAVVSPWKKMNTSDQKHINQLFVNIGKSLAAYMGTLQYSPNRFDQFAQQFSRQSNYPDALNQPKLNLEEQKGLKLFMGKAQCTNCHNGPRLSNDSFHNIGLPTPTNTQFDWGRATVVQRLLHSPYNCLGEYSDAERNQCEELIYARKTGDDLIGAFKTPSLRGISKTAPYMHSGQVEDLAAVIEHYVQAPASEKGHSSIQPIDLSDDEKKQLEAFLLIL